MEQKIIITIERQYGSGGHEIGVLLAHRLNIGFYDQEIIIKAAKESDLDQKVFETFDERFADESLYSLVMDVRAGRTNMGDYSQSIAEKVYLTEFETIKRLADDNSGIFIGRCADYVLQGYDNCINIFIHAPLEDRIERICKRNNVDKSEAETIIHRVDKEREKYYSYYATRKLDNACNYNLTIDTGKIGLECAVNLIEQYIQNSINHKKV